MSPLAPTRHSPSPPSAPSCPGGADGDPPTFLSPSQDRGGGAAGHNGIRSTIQHIGEDFRRVRIGIGHPGHKDRVTGYVLGNFAKAEQDDLVHMLGAIGATCEWLARDDDARFTTDLALRMQD